MSKLDFEYVPLTFISDKQEIKKQIRNTLILIHLFEKYNSPVRLENLIEGTQYGYNASALLSGTNKFLRISDITESKVDWETVPYCNCDDEKTYLLKKDDLLIARTGGTTGKSFKIENPPKNSIYAGYLIRIRAKETVNPDYIYLFLHSFAYWSQIVNLNERNFRPKANAENLKSLIIPDCPKEIQDEAVQLSQGETLKGYEELNLKIENALTEYDKTQEVERLIEEQLLQIENLNQSILQEAIQGKLVEQNPKEESGRELLKRIKAEKVKLVAEGKLKKEKSYPPISEEEIPFKIPKSWVWCRLSEAVYMNPRNKVEDNIEAGFIPMPFVSANYGSTPIFETRKWITIKNGFTHFANEDVVLAKITPCFENSKAGVMKELPNGIGAGTTELHVLRGNKNVVPEYIYCFIKRASFLKNGEKIMRGVAGQKRVPIDYVEGALFPLPPFQEQKRIVAAIENNFAKTQQIKTHITANQKAVEELLIALMHKAFELKEEMEIA